MSKKNPLILVTNDDGITARGLAVLVEAMSEVGEVVVVAPDSTKSGMGHAISIDAPLRLEKVNMFKNTLGYQCSGTPVDCVKVAIDMIMDKKPDLCMSGINHGVNSSINIMYSGTMSAAMEAAIEGIPAAGISLKFPAAEINFSVAKKYATIIAKQILKFGLPKNTLLNVNIPAIPENKIKGIKVCRQAIAKWEEEFDERVDPRGRKYYWLTGKFVNYDKGDDTDEWALANNYVSVVPVQFDLTAHHAIGYINKNWNL